MEYWDCGRDGLLTVCELPLCVLEVRREGYVDEYVRGSERRVIVSG